ncbi:SURF1 family cytochrome oxidase biogenesis protein [Pseudoalteromonas espejiana]
MQLILRRKQKLSSYIALCVVAIVVLVCVRLGYWQLERAAQKEPAVNSYSQNANPRRYELAAINYVTYKLEQNRCAS